MRAPMPASDRELQSLTFPIQYLEIGEALARELGQDVEPLYKAWGIDLPRPFMPWHTIDGVQMKRSLKHLLDHLPYGPPPIVAFMAHFPLTVHGPAGMLALTSANLGEALHGAIRYAPLIMPAFELHREDVGDEVRLVVEPKVDFGEVQDFFTETVTLAPTKVMPFLKTPVEGASVHFRHSPLGIESQYEAAFSGPIHFRARQNMLVLPRSALSIPLIAPSKASHLMMKATLEQQRKSRLDVRPVTYEVKEYLRAALGRRHTPSADEVAQTLALSARTLSRRLQDEGTTLPQLRGEVSIEHARTLLLETSKSIAQVAEATGFADATAFARAFKRATGMTPTALREQHTGHENQGPR